MSIRSKGILSCLMFMAVTSYGQFLKPEQIRFLERKAINIQVDSSYSKGHWKPILKHVKNKRIVLLGEFNHGSNEVFLTRNDLIKSLHEELGFNTILFEAGIGEMMVIDLEKMELSPDELTGAFFGIWNNQAFRDLMTYVQQEEISIGGYDVQRSGRMFGDELKRRLIDEGIDTARFANIEIRFGQIDQKLATRRRELYDSLKAPVEKLIQDYELLHDLLHRSDSKTAGWHLVKRTLMNRMTYLSFRLDFVKNRNWRDRFTARDSAMADNMDWLLENIYPNEKVIVVGHNYHVANWNIEDQVMGQILKQKYGEAMYSIGIFGGDGKYHGNAGDERVTDPADSTTLDIKHVIRSLKEKVSFFPTHKRRKGNEWLYESIVVNDSFTELNGSDRLNLAMSFDGVLLIDKVSPPKK